MADAPRKILMVSTFFETPYLSMNSISALSKAIRMARKDSALMSEWPFSKLLMAVFDRPEASARSCCVQARIPRAPRHCSIVIMIAFTFSKVLFRMRSSKVKFQLTKVCLYLQNFNKIQLYLYLLFLGEGGL